MCNIFRIFICSIFLIHSAQASCDLLGEETQKKVAQYLSFKTSLNLSNSIRFARATVSNTAIYISQFKIFDNEKKDYRIHTLTTTVECDQKGMPYISGDMNWSFVVSEVPELIISPNKDR